MSDFTKESRFRPVTAKSIPIEESVGMMLAHDVTEIRKDQFKGRAFRKGHIVRLEDIDHLRRIGKEHLFVLTLGPDDLHEDDAAVKLAAALAGEGAETCGEPREGKIRITAARDGLLTINREALFSINMLGDIICATRHTNRIVKQGRTIAETRAIPLVVKRSVLDTAVAIADEARASGTAVIRVREMRKPRAGVVITGNEVYTGRIPDAFRPVISKKIEDLGGEIIGVYYAPDDPRFIEARLRELIDAGADLLIATGGMSVDPDDVTRYAIAQLGAADISYGSPVLPGSMVLVGYLKIYRNGEKGTLHHVSDSPVQPVPDSSSLTIPILGIPACGMYHSITVIDLILPRLLAGEKIGRRELAELGHGGLCLQCKDCRYPVCPFGL